MERQKSSGSDKTVANAILKALEKLLCEDPIAFYELVKMCRGEHRSFGSTLSTLHERHFTDGAVHPLVRKIILSAVSGDEGEMMLTVPDDDTPRNRRNKDIVPM